MFKCPQNGILGGTESSQTFLVKNSFNSLEELKNSFNSLEEQDDLCALKSSFDNGSRI